MLMFILAIFIFVEVVGWCIMAYEVRHAPLLDDPESPQMRNSAPKTVTSTARILT